MASSSSPQVCWRPTCTKSTVSAPNKCPICKVTIYCSSKCRKDHRKEHKKECAEVGGREDVRLSKKLQEDVMLGKGSWKFAPEHSRLSAEEGGELMKLWANSMPPDRLSRFPAGTTPEQALDNLAIRPAFVHDLELGDWDALDRRIVMADRNIRVHNDPPLRPGDYVEVVPGNSVMWESVGQVGELLEYFPADGKWGIDLYPQPALIMEGNLKRVPQKS